MSWLTILRLFLRAGLPIIGTLLIGHVVVLSIGGEIRKGEVALALALILLSLTAGLLPADGADRR